MLAITCRQNLTMTCQGLLDHIGSHEEDLPMTIQSTPMRLHDPQKHANTPPSNPSFGQFFLSLSVDGKELGRVETESKERSEVVVGVGSECNHFLPWSQDGCFGEAVEQQKNDASF